MYTKSFAATATAVARNASRRIPAGGTIAHAAVGEWLGPVSAERAAAAAKAR